MQIQIIGVGCSRCQQMKSDVAELVNQLHLDAQVEYVDDPMQIVAMGILSVPQLKLNGKTVMVGYRGRNAIERALGEART